MKRVLVTGADGFIGRFTLPLLLQAGFEVHALCWHNQPEAVEEAQWHRVDLMQPEAVDALLDEIRPGYLLHLAWYTEHGRFWYASENTAWINASLSLLESFAAHGGKRVLMAGTCAEYDWRGGHCSEQATPCRPATHYGKSKLELYERAAKFCEKHSVSFAWGRVFFLYGPGEYGARFVPAVINGLLNGETVACSDGSQLRDFMHVADVATAFVRLLNSDLEATVNIASGRAKTLRQVGERIEALVGGNGRIDFGALPNRPDDPQAITADVSRLEQELHWTPAMSLDAGLMDAIRWWQKERERADV